VNALAFIFLLLVLEDVLIEVVLQVFVGVIDAKLLETVQINKKQMSISLRDVSTDLLPVHVAKILEAEDIQDSDRVAHVDLIGILLGQQGVVQLQDDPVEEGAVQTLGHGVSSGDGLSQSKMRSVSQLLDTISSVPYLGHAVIDDERLARGPGSFGYQRLVEDLLLDFEQVGDDGNDGSVLDADRFIVMIGRLFRLELHVANVQDGRQDGEDPPLGLGAEADHLHRLFEPRQLVTLVSLVQVVIVTLHPSSK